MEGGRASRVALSAVLVLLAGLVALPVKLASAPASVRVVGEPARPPTSSAPPVEQAPPLPVLTDAAPDANGDLAFATPDLGAASADAVPTVLVTPAPAPPSAAATDAGQHVKAVVVGIDDYPGTAHDLHAAVADAVDMASALARWGVPPQNVLLLEDGNATAGAIVGALRWLTDAAGPDDTAVFFYAGHARNLGFGHQALVGSDGWLLTDGYLAERLRPLRAHDAWIALAACFGGGFDELLAPGRIITAASDANSLAYENAGFGRSYLGQYLVRLGLLQGLAGGPTIQQAVAWAQQYLARDAPDRQITELDASTGPISLDGVRRDAVPAPAALPPPPPPSPAPGGAGPGGGTPPPSPPPAPRPPSPPTTVCRNLLGLLCPR